MTNSLTRLGNLLCIVVAIVVPAMVIFDVPTLTMGKYIIPVWKAVMYLGIACLVVNGITAGLTPQSDRLYQDDYWTTVLATWAVTGAAFYVAYMLFVNDTLLTTHWQQFPPTYLVVFGLMIGMWFVRWLGHEKHVRISRSLAAQRAAPPVLPAPVPVAPIAATQPSEGGNKMLWLGSILVVTIVVMALWGPEIKQFFKDLGLAELDFDDGKVVASCERFIGKNPDGVPVYRLHHDC